jgi:hypothetical protein
LDHREGKKAEALAAATLEMKNERIILFHAKDSVHQAVNLHTGELLGEGKADAVDTTSSRSVTS